MIFFIFHHLQIIFNTVLEQVDLQYKCITQDNGDMSNNSKDTDNTSLFSSRILVIRTAISTVASIVSEMPSFSHPYIVRILSSFLPLHYLYNNKNADTATIGTEVNQCLNIVITSIPARLSIPAIVQSTGYHYAQGHIVAKNFIRLQQVLWKELDRKTVTTYMQSLQLLMITSLDYRFNHGDQTIEGNEVDEIVIECCMELCLKFTEIELKSFLMKLLDICSYDNVDCNNSEIITRYGAWKQYAKSINFYHLIRSLTEKLKSIFVPTVLSVWFQISEYLNLYIQKVKDIQHTISNEEESLEYNINEKVSSKKRKVKEQNSVSISNSNLKNKKNKKDLDENNKLINDLNTHCIYILDIMRYCCLYDNNNLFDELQYEMVMPKICSLMPSITHMFINDEAYVQFCEEYIIPCMMRLVIGIGKDVLWKPMNHSVLLMTRHKMKCVRLVALKTIQKLFIDVSVLLIFKKLLLFVSL